MKVICMAAMTATNARNGFSKLLIKVSKRREPVAISRRGKIIAGLVAPEDFEYIKRLRAKEDAGDIRAADKAMKEYERTGKSIPLEKLKKKYGQ